MRPGSLYRFCCMRAGNPKNKYTAAEHRKLFWKTVGRGEMQTHSIVCCRVYGMPRCSCLREWGKIHSTERRCVFWEIQPSCSQCRVRASCTWSLLSVVQIPQNLCDVPTWTFVLCLLARDNTLIFLLSRRIHKQSNGRKNGFISAQGLLHQRVSFTDPSTLEFQLIMHTNWDFIAAAEYMTSGCHSALRGCRQ